jgi:hypothetical protein
MGWQQSNSAYVLPGNSRQQSATEQQSWGGVDEKTIQKPPRPPYKQ